MFPTYLFTYIFLSVCQNIFQLKTYLYFFFSSCVFLYFHCVFVADHIRRSAGGFPHICLHPYFYLFVKIYFNWKSISISLFPPLYFFTSIVYLWLITLGGVQEVSHTSVYIHISICLSKYISTEKVFLFLFFLLCISLLPLYICGWSH